jgi:hypothetical protein
MLRRDFVLLRDVDFFKFWRQSLDRFFLLFAPTFKCSPSGY